jgi:hypothetical protein
MFAREIALQLRCNVDRLTFGGASTCVEALLALNANANHCDNYGRSVAMHAVLAYVHLQASSLIDVPLTL